MDIDMLKSGLSAKRNCVTRINTVNTSEVNIIPATIPTGELNSTNLELLLNQYETSVVYFQTEFGAITSITEVYGKDLFYKSVEDLNLYVIRQDVSALISPEKYPLLSERIQTGIIFSPVEVANFISDYGYTPEGLSDGTSTVSEKIISDLESFYAENFSTSTMGGFCALLPNIFGAVDIFFNTIDDIENISNKLKNFSLEFSLKTMLDSLKKQIGDVVDLVVNNVKSIIENYSIRNIMQKIETAIQNQLFSKFNEIKRSALKFFDDLNIENFKKRIYALIDYAANVFKNPNIEEIQFLLFRFCGFISKIEEEITELKTPLDNFANSYNEALTITSSKSSVVTAKAVQAGAVRFSEEKRVEETQSQKKVFEDSGNVKRELTVEEKSIPITQWNNGKGDSRVTFSGRCSWQRESWEELNQDTLERFMLVQKEFNQQLIAISGYRSFEDQKAIYDRALKRKMDAGQSRASAIQDLRNEVAKPGNSLHEKKNAIDVKWAGFPNRKSEFLAIARKHGFTGIGKKYKTFVHIDTRKVPTEW